MITPISFCINTAKNERPYLELLLGSLYNGIDINTHEIIIFIDSDNQNTTELLMAQKETFPNLKIIKNKTNTPWGYQKNINYMIQYSKHDIISYIQSDMIVNLGYDISLLKHLDQNTILSSTRIEPPLHCQFDNAVTYVKNFGLNPEEFDYDSFIRYAEEKKNPYKTTEYFFAPFTCYKDLWLNIGGHDEKFRYSREDSDICYRFCLNKYKLIQCWDAIVYHFSCTSSRGINWWSLENREKEITRKKNDELELQRFINKWGQFKHPMSYNDVTQDIINNPSILNNIICKNPPFPIDELEML